jgi:hypothetical protein
VFLRSSGKSLTKISFIEGINAALHKKLQIARKIISVRHSVVDWGVWEQFGRKKPKNPRPMEGSVLSLLRQKSGS